MRAWLTLLAVLAALAGCGSEAGPSRTDGGAGRQDVLGATSELGASPHCEADLLPTDYDLFAAAIANLATTHSWKKVLIDDEIGGPAEWTASQPVQQYTKGAGLDATTTDSLVCRNVTTRALGTSLTLSIPWEALPKAQLTGNLKTLVDQHGASVLLMLSKPGLASVGGQAIVYVAASSSSVGGEGYYVALERDAGLWRVTQLISLWIS